MKVMITGASGYFGNLLAERLRADARTAATVVGVDVREKVVRGDEKDVKFIHGDTRKKRIEDVFKIEGKIDAVVHLARETDPALTSDHLMITNVYGTFHMLELARKYGVRKFVFPSSSIVYGAREDNPAMIRENHPLLGNRDIPAIRDRVEADLICQTFAHSAEDFNIVILRFAPIWRRAGAGILSDYMSGDTVPTLLGFDPMFQIIFEEEVIEAFILALANARAAGAYNVPGSVFMPLSEVVRRMGKKTLPLPEFLVHYKYRFFWSKNLKFDFNYIKYPFTVDGSRAREELGYRPEEIGRERQSAPAQQRL
ncbi:MAG: NAD-dependent epimerase/dehydratase family protein [bacterium]